MGHWPVTDGRPAATALVASVTSSGLNAKGTWVQLTGSLGLPFDTDLLAVQLRSSGVDQNSLADIGVGAAASEVVVVPNLYDSYDGLVTELSRSNGYVLCPVSIPKGSRLAARCQASVSNGGCEVVVLPCGGGFRRATPLGSVTDYGTNTTNSRGTAVVSGTGAFGSWTQLVASTSRTIHALALMAGVISLTGDTTVTVDLGIGAAGSEVAVMEMYGVLRGSTQGGSDGLALGFLPCLIPAGTRLAARVNSAAADTFYVNAYGVA